MDVTEQRVAASTFFLGFAARLWSIGVGSVAGYRMLVDLPPERLLFRESDGQIALHLEHPATRRREDLADMVLDRHLDPLAVALRRLGPISERMLAGNTRLGPARRGAGVRSRPGHRRRDGNWPAACAPTHD